MPLKSIILTSQGLVLYSYANSPKVLPIALLILYYRKKDGAGSISIKTEVTRTAWNREGDFQLYFI